MRRKIHVIQDGSSFFVMKTMPDGKQQAETIYTWNQPVRDHDMDAAQQARFWFLTEALQHYDPDALPIHVVFD